MSSEQSIRDEIAEIIAEEEEYPHPRGYTGHADAILDSAVIRRIRAEAIRKVAKSGQAKMFTPAVYVGPERLRVGISAEKWLLEEADRIERGETA